MFVLDKESFVFTKYLLAISTVDRPIMFLSLVGVAVKDGPLDLY